MDKREKIAEIIATETISKGVSSYDIADQILSLFGGGEKEFKLPDDFGSKSEINPKILPDPPKQEWEGKFDEKFSAKESEKIVIRTGLSLDWVEQIKSFIRTLLSTQKETFKKELGKKIEKIITNNNEWKNVDGNCALCMEQNFCYHDIANEAISECKKIIEEY